MTLAIHCPECDSRLNVPATAVGRHARCPHCHSSIVVPKPKPIPMELDFDSPLALSLATQSGGESKPKKHSNSVYKSRWFRILAGTTAVVFVLSVLVQLPLGKTPPEARLPNVFIIHGPDKQPQSWKALDPESLQLFKGNGYEVMFPNSPSGTPSNADFGRWHMFNNASAVQLKNGRFNYIAFRRTIPAVPANPQDELEHIVTNLKNSIFTARVIDKQVLQVGGFPAVQIVLKDSNLYCVFRMVLSGDSLVIVAVETNDDLDDNHPEIQRYFQSLTIRPPARDFTNFPR